MVLVRRGLSQAKGQRLRMGWWSQPLLSFSLWLMSIFNYDVATMFGFTVFPASVSLSLSKYNVEFWDDGGFRRFSGLVLCHTLYWEEDIPMCRRREGGSWFRQQVASCLWWLPGHYLRDGTGFNLWWFPKKHRVFVALSLTKHTHTQTDTDVHTQNIHTGKRRIHMSKILSLWTNKLFQHCNRVALWQ